MVHAKRFEWDLLRYCKCLFSSKEVDTIIILYEATYTADIIAILICCLTSIWKVWIQDPTMELPIRIYGISSIVHIYLLLKLYIMPWNFINGEMQDSMYICNFLRLVLSLVFLWDFIYNSSWIALTLTIHCWVIVRWQNLIICKILN